MLRWFQLFLSWICIYFLPYFYIIKIISWIYFILSFSLFFLVFILIKVNFLDFREKVLEIPPKHSLKFNILLYYPIIGYLAFNGFFGLSILIFLYFYLIYYILYCKNSWNI
jgi:hypothetical protein